MGRQRNSCHRPFEKVKKSLSNENGLSLIEILLAVTITTFITGVIYSLFITGLSLYQKIQIEGQLREDADYIATMIMNELTTNQPKYVTPLNEDGKNGVTLNVQEEKTVDGFIIEDSKGTEPVDIYFKDSQFIIDNKGVLNTLNLSTSSFIDINEGTQTEKKTGIRLDTDSSDCTRDPSGTLCTHSTIHVTMVIENNIHAKGFFVTTEPLVLESSFGF
ncbi:PilW family protein [Peribacillus sp. NPDC097264]|uniref:PilW family protein n=1 Tax=Peribacillus sp. NPDC097264 TaxID=3390616 RepID=UPI003D088363